MSGTRLANARTIYGRRREPTSFVPFRISLAVDSKSCGMSGSSGHSSSSNPSSSSSSASSVSFPYESSMSSRCGATKNVRRTLRAEEKSPASSSACACGNPRATNASATTEAITADISSGAASLSASENCFPSKRMAIRAVTETAVRRLTASSRFPSRLCHNLTPSDRVSPLQKRRRSFSGNTSLSTP